MIHYLLVGKCYKNLEVLWHIYMPVCTLRGEYKSLNDMVTPIRSGTLHSMLILRTTQEKGRLQKIPTPSELPAQTFLELKKK